MISSMTKINKMTNEELVKEFRTAYDSVNVSECFGTFDLRLLQRLTDEIAKRGGEPVEAPPTVRIKGRLYE